MLLATATVRVAAMVVIFRLMLVQGWLAVVFNILKDACDVLDGYHHHGGVITLIIVLKSRTFILFCTFPSNRHGEISIDGPIGKRQ